MATWIFQGNPNTFDVDGYLEQCNSSVLWLVRQHAKEIAVGDCLIECLKNDPSAPKGTR